MLSLKAKYALRALIVLASEGAAAPMATAAVARAANVPPRFLEQIMGELRNAGLVESRRGRHGGYRLLKPADAIAFGTVIRLIDGPIAPLPCLSQTAYRACEDCAGEDDCAIRRVFSGVAEATRAVLDHTSIEAATLSAADWRPIRA